MNPPDFLPTPTETDLGDGRLLVTVPYLAEHPEWIFRVKARFTEDGVDLGAVQACRKDGPEQVCPRPVLRKVADFVRNYLGAGDIDPSIALVRALLWPALKYGPEHLRAEAAAVVYQMEQENFEIARRMGKTAPGEQPNPRAAVSRAFEISFGVKNTIAGKRARNEQDPGSSADNWISLARRLERPGTTQPYLPPHKHAQSRPVAAEPEPSRVITVFAWRPRPRPREDDTPLPHTMLGPDVHLRACWTDLRRHFEDRRPLPTLAPLTCVSPAEVPQGIITRITQLEQMFPDAVVRAVISHNHHPPKDFPDDD